MLFPSLGPLRTELDVAGVKHGVPSVAHVVVYADRKRGCASGQGAKQNHDTLSAWLGSSWTDEPGSSVIPPRSLE